MDSIALERPSQVSQKEQQLLNYYQIIISLLCHSYTHSNTYLLLQISLRIPKE